MEAQGVSGLGCMGEYATWGQNMQLKNCKKNCKTMLTITQMQKNAKNAKKSKLKRIPL